MNPQYECPSGPLTLEDALGLDGLTSLSSGAVIADFIDFINARPELMQQSVLSVIFRYGWHLEAGERTLPQFAYTPIWKKWMS